MAGLHLRTSICVVNKVDAASRRQVLQQLEAAAALVDYDEYFPRLGADGRRGRARSSRRSLARMPEGPLLYPDDMVTDVPEAFWVAELVREQLLAVTRDEVPHSIACRVTEWEWPRIRCEILVERDSQKGIVIGKGGCGAAGGGIAGPGAAARRAPTWSCSSRSTGLAEPAAGARAARVLTLLAGCLTRRNVTQAANVSPPLRLTNCQAGQRRTTWA